MKKILITGANSYIGTSFEKYMEQFGEDYSIDTVDMIGDSWKSKSFSGYDCVFHVAGIAHQKETLENAHLYYEVNRNLAIATAKKAKSEGVEQFILLSSMSVYGMETGVITKKTVPHPKSHYGKSKLQADERIVKLNCDTFRVAILRPPMVYGNGCKGNYQRLRSFALRSPIFPDYPNKRSMVYIDNLCAFIKDVIDENKYGLFFSQDSKYVNTSEMVKEIAKENGKHIRMTKLFNPFIRIAPFGIVKKVFGSLIYCFESNDDGFAVKDSPTHKRKALFIASMASMLDNFNRNNISILDDMGYEITLAAYFKDEDSNSLEKNKQFFREMSSKGYNVVHIDFSRSVFNLAKQFKSICQVRKLLKNQFDLVHCHSPICSVITRLLFRKYRKKQKGKIIYTAHGFHFYTGAPLKNWLIYYPIERLLSRYTDVLITINKEDFKRAKSHFRANKTLYIPGIGVDLKRINNTIVDVENKRAELGINNDLFVLLSVGELSVRKNQSVVLEALAQIKNKNPNMMDRILYLVVGKGDMNDRLIQLSKKYGIDSNVRFLGFRTDVYELMKMSDAFIFPSLQEGLPVALMEAMGSGLPCVASKIRGNVDLLGFNDCFLLNPSDVSGFKESIIQIMGNSILRNKMKNDNMENVRKYDILIIDKKMRNIYHNVS